MTDKPILFSGPMVRAILEGRKTQTRRVLNPQPHARLVNGDWEWWSGFIGWRPMSDELAHPLLKQHVLRYAIGDRLWVRECVSLNYFDDGSTAYRADWHSGSDWHSGADEAFDQPKWRPSIHMPRWASRITAPVTDVRVQRLQDISEADARAEGVLWVPGHGEITMDDLRADPGYSNFLNCRQGFQYLWDSLNANRKDKDGNRLPYAWDDNPWVVAVTTEPYACNIDHFDPTAKIEARKD
jgi:hypothetical protein